MKHYFTQVLSTALAVLMIGSSVSAAAAFPASAQAEPQAQTLAVPSQAEWQQRLEQYLVYDNRTQCPPYPGLRIAPYEAILGEGETLQYQVMDEKGQDRTSELDWYVFTSYPFSRLFSLQESNDDTIPPYMSGDEIDVQRTSPVRINAPGSITARSIAGKQSQLTGWVVGIYQDKYVQVLPVTVKKGPFLDEIRVVEQEISRVLHEMNNLSDPDKAVYAFDYILDRVRYDRDFSHDTLGNPALYKTLIEQWAVCDGYARAYEYLMKRAGIKAEYQFGEVLTGGAQGETSSDLHAWNRIWMEDGWYYMDTTWADLNPPNYRYLFTSRDFMAAERILPDDGTNMGTKYLGYRRADPNAAYRVDQTVAEQVARIKDTLSPNTTDVLIFISYDENPNDLQYDIPDMISDPALGITCENGIPQGPVGDIGVLFRYPVQVNSPVPLQAVQDTHTLMIDGGEPCIRIQLDRDVELTRDNIFLTNADYGAKGLVKVSNREYKLYISGLTVDSLQIELRKTGYDFLPKTTISLGDRMDVEAPQAVFTGTGYQQGLLSNLAPNAEYNLGDGVWIPAGKDTVALELPHRTRDRLYLDNITSIYVRNRSELGTCSDTQQIRISRSMTGPRWVQKEVDTAETNRIVSVLNTEYRLKNTGEWTAATADVLTDLPKGTYEFRIKGDRDRFASEPVEITIENLEYQPPKPQYFDLAGTTMVLGSDLSLNFFVDSAALKNRTDVYAKITKEYADGRDSRVEVLPYSAWLDDEKGMKKIPFDGIAAKEMMDNVAVQIFAEDHTPLSNVYTKNIHDYAMYLLEKPDTKPRLKTLLVDMLNYGAAAQTRFRYSTDKLVNSDLTEAQRKLATQELSAADARVPGDNYMTTTVSLESRIILNLYFRNISRDMTATVTYTDHYGSQKRYTYSGTEFVGSKDAQSLGVPVDKLAVADGRVKVSCVVRDTNGHVVASADDSVVGYAARALEKSTDTALNHLLEMIVKFSQSSAAFFQE